MLSNNFDNIGILILGKEMVPLNSIATRRRHHFACKQEAGGAGIL